MSQELKQQRIRRSMVRAGLALLGRDAVTIGLDAFAHPHTGSFCNCFLGCIVLGDLQYDDSRSAPTPLAFEVAGDLTHSVFRDFPDAEAKQMNEVSDAFECYSPILDEEIERLLGFSVDEGLRVIYGTQRAPGRV